MYGSVQGVRDGATPSSTMSVSPEVGIFVARSVVTPGASLAAAVTAGVVGDVDVV